MYRWICVCVLLPDVDKRKLYELGLVPKSNRTLWQTTIALGAAVC